MSTDRAAPVRPGFTSTGTGGRERCVRCDHRREEQSADPADGANMIRRLLRLPLKPAQCGAMEKVADAWGEPGCRCRASFHGS